MQTLADAHDFRITLHRAEEVAAPTNDTARSGKLVVTFDGQPSDLGDSGFGTRFCQDQGWDNIYVAQRHGTQYQGLTIEAFHKVVAPLSAGRDVVCYGSSLGAYAAFYYGGSIDARIIGGAPMFPAWRAFANPAYADLAITHHDLSEVPRSSKAPVAIYDPLRRPDVRMVEDMIAPVYPDLRRLPYEGAGHTVLITLQQSRQLKPLIVSLIDRDEVIPIEPLAEGSAVYHRTRGRLLQASDSDAAQRELERSLEIEPSRQTLSILLAMFLRHGRLDSAQDWIDRAEASSDRNLTITQAIRERLRTAGLRVS